MYDNTPLTGIFEQDPHKLPDGRIINAAHFQPGLKLCPIYTDDPTGKTGWKKGNFEYTESADQSAELEPIFFAKWWNISYGDQKNRYISLAAKSDDRGETWSKSMITNMPDSRAKQCAGNLIDGTVFFVNNPGKVTNDENKTWRVPLSITLSKDGFIFSKTYLLRSGKMMIILNKNILAMQILWDIVIQKLLFLKHIYMWVIRQIKMMLNIREYLLRK